METKALNDFILKIQKFSKIKNIGSKVASQIAERGVEMARDEYRNSQMVILSV